MVAKNLIADVLSLPVAERLEIFERLRDDLINGPERASMSQTQKQLLDERLTIVEQREPFGDFAAGEFDELLAQGERSIASDGTIPAKDVFSELRCRAAKRFKTKSSRGKTA